MLSSFIAPSCLHPGRQRSLRSQFENGKPFSHLVLRDFLVENVIQQIAKALQQEEFAVQESDLYQFTQTRDFGTIASGPLASFYRFLCSTEFKEYLQHITGIHAPGKVDCSAFLYRATDYLLPHDDRMAGRKIAYTLHLSKDFARSDGGALEFFSGSKIEASLPPRFNTLVLFPVIEGRAVHQVSEMMAEKELLSIFGWFHA
jgi:Rps23 Pro-64 3,4-dihydroxylase Tpa1-like proline 4-hydroxylase